MNERFREAIRLIDEANAGDPNHDIVSGQSVPRELLYSQRLSDWVLKLAPDASESLRLAARSQHICRWRIPRSDFPAGKTGYHQWKNAARRFHADRTSNILKTVGYDELTIGQVQALNLKKNFPVHPDARVLEDALCLMFLQYQFAELAAKSPPDNIINALRKSWAKMTQNARNIALTLDYGPEEKALLEEALDAGQGIA